MERRAEIRFEVNQAVTVTLLNHARARSHGQVVNLAGRGMKLLLDRPIAPGSPVRVDAENIMFLGDVRYCRPEGATYAAGIQVEHVLTHLDDLARLNRRLLGEPSEEASQDPDTAPVRKRDQS